MLSSARSSGLFGLVGLLLALAPFLPTSAHDTSGSRYTLDGKPLPSDWIYGCATSAYQIEGAWNVSGKGVSIWDTFAHDKGKGHVANGDTGDVAVDFYHRYKSDFPLFKKALDVGVYDFTISWTRLLLNGTGSKPLKAGVKFYRDVITSSHEAGMDTFCTLYHWDLPQALQDRYGGWLSPNIVHDFRNYAKVAFDAFGDVCTNWITMNEPRTFCVEGYGTDTDSVPGHEGPIDEKYTCMDHALLAHANAVDDFRKGGKKDQDAVQHTNDFEMGWDVAPLYTGDYPPIMREVMGSRLPAFNKAQSALLKGSTDFLGFDAYTSQWVTPTQGKCEYGDETWPRCIDSTSKREDTNELIGRPTESVWNFQYNSTVYDGLKYLHSRWGAGPIIVSENGMAIRNDSMLPMAQILTDVDRIEWYRSTFRNLQWALDDGLPLKGFVPWSCLSNLEWSGGFHIDFGLIKVEIPSLERSIKKSARYVAGVMTRGLPIDPFDF